MVLDIARCLRHKVLHNSKGDYIAMKLEFNIGKWTEGQHNTIEDRLRIKQKNIAKALDYDICISFMFNDFQNVLFCRAYILGVPS